MARWNKGIPRTEETKKKLALALLGNKNNLGRCKPGLEAKEHPTNIDIAWAAGIWEGEGNCCSTSWSKEGQKHTTTKIVVTQKDPWLLNKLKLLFGGSICKHSFCFQWSITGARARGFIMTIYTFLSPRRKEQVRNVL